MPNEDNKTLKYNHAENPSKALFMIYPLLIIYADITN